MDPYTPRTRTGGGSRKKATLTNKEYTKITSTIASVRRNRELHEGGGDRDGPEVRGAMNGRRHAVVGGEEPSFISETSFVRAPLNSRVPSSSGIPPRGAGGPGSGSRQASRDPKGKAKATDKDSLEGVPIDIQEAVILEDLLYVLMGIEGTYITYHPIYSPRSTYPTDEYTGVGGDDDGDGDWDPLQGIRFVVDPSLDPSLTDLLLRILPLSTYYTSIQAFIEQRSEMDWGLVNHALVAGLRGVMKDYQTLLSQLEHTYTTSPTFSLQKLWFYIHPTLHTLSLLSLITSSLSPPSPTPSSSSSPSESEDEGGEKDEALGLGGFKLKAVLKKGLGGSEGEQGEVKGGEVLSVIYELLMSMSGDPVAKRLFGVLLKAAGVPYVAMLKSWIGRGRLIDVYEECCVKESKFIDRGLLEVDYVDEYWERRYTLRDGSTLSGPSKRQAGVPLARTPGGRLPGGACIPQMLEGWKYKILLAGKYLNVIRECGIEVEPVGGGSEEEEEEMGLGDEKFYKYIDATYTHANQTLLTLLLRDQHLLLRLRSLKHFFFLSNSSFLTHFLDLAGSELRKSARGASLVKLQSLLEVVVGGEDPVEGFCGGVGGGGGWKEDVKVTMASSGLYEWLLKVVSVSGVIGDGPGEVGGEGGGGGEEHRREKEKDDKKQLLAIDALTLDYHVSFPLSLVISRKTILRYQLLFRFLLHLKHVEQSLSAMWIEQKASTPWRRPPPPCPPTQPPIEYAKWKTDFERWRLRVCLLRARMLGFVQQVLGFATFEVLEPNWRMLEKKLGDVKTVDELLRDHVDFLDTCLKECMLTSSRLLKAYSKLIVTCSTFALYTSNFTKSANQALAAAESPEGDLGMAKRWDFLGKFETNFNHWFKVHLDCVQYYASSENVSLLPLVVRLNSIKTPT
ncbi:hypothetical protein JAAARDRAFT_184745 [Jaapia argillacea MUCL 33604]|uniref:Spindle pole body component n=1 Tax=Jaapia argillacea MUCL 33604 TaxID=933084 RepID=A0A067PDJ8_9AGAM|nr:hypothetical protein JAAARDRAFT_184745 [Jaapia argillacea MUCL 33604]